MDKRLAAFKRLLEIMDELRAKCPWDKKQTYESLRHLTIEETYELAEAIVLKDSNEIKNELGDLLLHIIFYSKIGEESKEFNITDVIEGITEKLIQRHPHIFGDVVADTDEVVKSNWEKIKLQKGGKSVLNGVPASLPSIIKAYRIQDKARGVGFDWEETSQVWDKVIEEMRELKHEVDSSSGHEAIEGEFGDLLFALINYSRFINVNPDTALERTNNKFINRFNYLEEHANKSKKSLHDMTLKEMDVFWNEAKKKYH
jgi:XTP/dITP diphosphohydrolase